MLNQQKMREQVEKFMLEFDMQDKEVWLLKSKGEVKLTVNRAIEWVNAGIIDIDCRSKERMLEILQDWANQ